MENAWQEYLDAAYREYERSRLRAPTLYPHYTASDTWEVLDVDALSTWHADTYDHGNWTAGFWFGIMWLVSLGTGDEGPAALARERIDQIRRRRYDHTTHDLGFLFYPSAAFGHTYGLVDDVAADWCLEAASMTVRRFNGPGGYIQAFGPVGENRSAGTSTIDTMMNLPLLWWAHRRGADPLIFDVARRHARTSARLFLRPDGSTVHLLQFDPVNGALLEQSTLQGAGPRSSWSRGQAWAVCGFAWTFAATGEQELLTAAEDAATYFWNQLKVSPGQLPPWDFTDTSTHAPRDASAGAVAALGMLILGRVHPNASTRADFDHQGRKLLAETCDLALNRDAQTDGILLYSCYSYPHQRGLDGATAWGDFYLGLALALATDNVPLDMALGLAGPGA